MISLVLPYWRRQKAANAALRLLGEHYQGLDLEVVVVDDGSPEPFICPPVALNLRVVRLPTKHGSKSPCVPLNAGVRASVGDVIALSCVEMLHINPVLPGMREELRDDSTYVSAAVWAPESKEWHAHSSLNRPPLNFLTMMKRSLWERTGGFDEDYREGMAFEDNDFVERLKRAGAKFVVRDDLVVEHPRLGAKAIYSPEQHERNRVLYEQKWL